MTEEAWAEPLAQCNSQQPGTLGAVTNTAFNGTEGAGRASLVKMRTELEVQPKGPSKPGRLECLPRAHDSLLHFTRCLKFGERDKHLQNAHGDLRGQVNHLLSRVQDLRSHVEARSDGEFWTTRLADHMADFRAKPQPRKTERKLATALSRMHIGSRTSQVNIPTIRVGDKTLSTPNIAAVLGGTCHPNRSGRQSGKEHEYKGLQAGAVYFKGGEPYTHPKLPGRFPDQTTPVVDLLARDSDRSVLMEQCEEGMLRWFHIPANNMAWVEVQCYGVRVPKHHLLC